MPCVVTRFLKTSSVSFYITVTSGLFVLLLELLLPGWTGGTASSSATPSSLTSGLGSKSAAFWSAVFFIILIDESFGNNIEYIGLDPSEKESQSFKSIGG